MGVTVYYSYLPTAPSAETSVVKKLTQKVTHCKNVCYICVVATKSKLKNTVNKL